MLCPIFYTDPGDESFAPTVQHENEDAGADIRAWVKGDYVYSRSAKFYRDYERDNTSSLASLWIDGKSGDELLERQFINFLEATEGSVLIAPGEKVLISAGFKVILPNTSQMGYPWNSLISVYKIVPRSGLANKHGIIVTNSPGIIDSGYQDWVKVSLTNTGNDYHVFTHGSRIAQGLCELVVNQAKRQVVTNDSVFQVTQRSAGGFGSTGSK